MKNTRTEAGSKKKGMSKKQMAMLGGAAVVAGAAGAGAYYLLGPKSKTHQKKTKVLINKIKKELSNKAKQAKDMSEPIYHNAVDALAMKYSQEYKVHEKEIQAIAKKLKGQWKKPKAKKTTSKPKRSAAKTS